MSSNFLTARLDVTGLQDSKGMLYLAELLIKYEDRIKTFLDMQRIKK